MNSLGVRVSILILAVILCCLAFVACGEKPDEKITDFVADNEHCVVSLPTDYDIVFENEAESYTGFNRDLYNADTVDGEKKKDGFRYYYLLQNERFRILTPLGIIQEKNRNMQTLVYWELNGVYYKDGDNYYSENVFACVKNTEITPVYCNFRAVGMLLYEADENDAPTVEDGELFDTDGKIVERDGLYYLYGVYDFEPDREFWRTNLTIKSFAVHHTVQAVSENYSRDFYTLTVEIGKKELFKSGKLIVETLYKIEGHGYMTYGAMNIVYNDLAVLTMPIGKHEIKYSFT